MEDPYAYPRKRYNIFAEALPNNREPGGRGRGNFKYLLWINDGWMGERARGGGKGFKEEAGVVFNL